MISKQTGEELVRAWEENQRAGWMIADAVKSLRDVDGEAGNDEKRRMLGAALDAIDHARRGQNASNSLLKPAQEEVAEALRAGSAE